MTVQWSTTLRNALLDQWETSIGVSAVVKIRTGAAPANCAAADSGNVLVEFDLAADWATAAALGVKSLDSLPVSALAVDTGAAAHYRIYESTETTCHEQGTVTLTAGGGDMTIDNTSIVLGQTVQITAFNKTAPGV